MRDYFSQSQKVTFEVIGILALNCRKPRSSQSVQDTLLNVVMTSPCHQLSNEAAILLGLLEKDFQYVITFKLHRLLSHIVETDICLPNTASSLYPVVEELHAVGLLMIIRGSSDNLEDHSMLLNVSKLTNEVHQLLFSKSAVELLSASTDPLSASMGILLQSYLNSILPEHIGIDCLIQLQYCQEFSHAKIMLDYSVTPTEDSSVPTLLYFPALCTTERKKSIITPGNYTYSIGWFAECEGKYDYFPSRLLHVLLLRLAFSFAHPVAPCETEGETDADIDIIKSNCGCTMWKNGICLLYTSPSPRDATLSRMPSSA